MASAPPFLPPPPKCFCFSMKSIEPDYEVQSRRVTPLPDSLWLPPTECKAFTAIADTNWHYWYEGTVYEVPIQKRKEIQLYSTSSIFWSHDRQAFLHIPCDCTEIDLKKAMGGDKKDVPLRWGKISFHNETKHNQCLSLIGYGFEKNQLGAKGSSRWVPELLPEIYQYQGTTQQGACHLAGDLSILLGLAAFSTSPQTPVKEIGAYLKRTAAGTEWASHGRVGEGSKAEFHWLTNASLTVYREGRARNCGPYWCRPCIRSDNRLPQSVGKWKMWPNPTMSAISSITRHPCLCTWHYFSSS
jgi:hypothetical protein